MLGLVPCEVFGYLLSGRVVDDVSRGATAYLCVVSLLPKSLSLTVEYPFRLAPCASPMTQL